MLENKNTNEKQDQATPTQGAGQVQRAIDPREFAYKDMQRASHVVDDVNHIMSAWTTILNSTPRNLTYEQEQAIATVHRIIQEKLPFIQ